jgi:dTMP kinase
MAQSARGRFITLEGGEGTGKSTLQSSLRDRLAGQGVDVVLTREPGGTPRAEAIRALVLAPPGGKPFSSLAEALLMNAARHDHLDQFIRPALDAGRWVVCDRFSDSTRVYQGVSGGVSPEVLRSLETCVVGSTRPDLTLILDAPVNVAHDRRAARKGTQDVFEQRDLEFHQSVRLAFSEIARDEPNRCKLIDASRPAPEVADAAWVYVAQLLMSAEAN